ncbi:MAG: hypothetical protein N2385_14435, partial [Chloroflexus sp.]|nr:hypothetical protein [Chloroflexus sp.]
MRKRLALILFLLALSTTGAVIPLPVVADDLPTGRCGVIMDVLPYPRVADLQLVNDDEQPLPDGHPTVVTDPTSLRTDLLADPSDPTRWIVGAVVSYPSVSITNVELGQSETINPGALV